MSKLLGFFFVFFFLFGLVCLIHDILGSLLAAIQRTRSRHADPRYRERCHRRRHFVSLILIEAGRLTSPCLALVNVEGHPPPG